MSRFPCRCMWCDRPLRSEPGIAPWGDPKTLSLCVECFGEVEGLGADLKDEFSRRERFRSALEAVAPNGRVRLRDLIAVARRVGWEVACEHCDTPVDNDGSCPSRCMERKPI